MESMLHMGTSPAAVEALSKAILLILENKGNNDQITLQKAFDVLLKGTDINNATVKDCTFTGDSYKEVLDSYRKAS